MSSPPEGKVETKAGHPPAVKAGGMRIVQKHPHTGDAREERDKEDQEWESPRRSHYCPGGLDFNTAFLGDTNEPITDAKLIRGNA
ncbi:death-associated protein 1 isoform X2 [Cavia porcellus]|uniref:death-associated protein 1 isoform X2 n=1 Tax=Cavia porcellus TaxID=10141 RepID=UPI002FE087C3